LKIRVEDLSGDIGRKFLRLHATGGLSIAGMGHPIDSGGVRA
jgi:hypothetical protein